MAEIDKVLGAVSNLVGKSYKVIFEKDMSTGQDLSMMTNKNIGVTCRFHRMINMWVLDAFIDLKDQTKVTKDSQDFNRRGRP